MTTTSYPSRFEGIDWQTERQTPFDLIWYASADKFMAFADGGYPLAYVCADGATLCAACATDLVHKNREATVAWRTANSGHVREATPSAFGSADVIIGADIEYECETDLLCDECHKVICEGYANETA